MDFKICVLHMFVFQIVLTFGARSSTFRLDGPISGNRHVIIVGAGIGGTSCAYYLSKQFGNTSITVIESTGDIGGRIKNITVHGKVIEVGAAAWATSNRYLVELSKELQIPVEVQGASLENTASASKGSLLSWDGHKTWDLVEVLQTHAISALKVAIELGTFLARLETNYLERDLTGKPFHFIPDFLEVGSLSSYASRSGEDFFQGVSAELKFAGMDPLLRHIYDQQLDGTQAFASFVAYTGAIETAYSAKEGNSMLPRALLSASGAQALLESTVTALTQNTDKSYSVDYKTQSGKTKTIHADAVVIAAPLEWTGIKFPNFKPLKKQPVRNWVNWFVSIVTASRIDPHHFGQNESWVEPEFILTTLNSTAPWVSIQHLDTAGAVNIYKIFSRVNMTAFVSNIFEGVVQVYDHFWTYTFPVLAPLSSGTQYQSIELAKGLYNINAMESVVSAMEGSVISGRNTAKLLTEYLMSLERLE